MRTILYYKNRIALLESRDPIANKGIINKLYRKLRALERATNNT